MGGQACVFYGAAEFSRDLDLLILANPANLDRLRAAFVDLEAGPIAVPPLDEAVLARGHAAHFRCQRDDVKGLRIDVMSTFRGGSSFENLWERRTTIEVDGEPIELLSLQDLMHAKKTQRDKDWPMIARLIERSYFESKDSPSDDHVTLWLQELRTPDLLVEVARAHSRRAGELANRRPAIAAALAGAIEQASLAIDDEEREERRLDREYWAPLKQELELLRHRSQKL
jgi:hypothetical protein